MFMLPYDASCFRETNKFVMLITSSVTTRRYTSTMLVECLYDICVVLLCSATGQQWIAVFRNADIPEFAAGINRTQRSAWTSFVDIVISSNSSAWLSIICIIIPLRIWLRPLTAISELPAAARWFLVCRPGIWTGISAVICQPVVPPVVCIGRRVFSIVASFNALPGIYQPSDWFRVYHAFRFTAPLWATVRFCRLPVLGSISATTVIGLCHWPVGVSSRTLSWAAGHLSGVAVWTVWPLR